MMRRQTSERRLLFVSLGEIEGDGGEGGYANFDAGDDAVERGGILEPIGGGFEEGCVAGFFAGERIGDRQQRERGRFASDGGDDLDGGRGDADEVLEFAVHDVERKFARGGVAHEFKMIGLLAEDDGRAAVGRDMLVLVRRVIVAGVRIGGGGFGLGLGTGGEREEESGRKKAQRETHDGLINMNRSVRKSNHGRRTEIFARGPTFQNCNVRESEEKGSGVIVVIMNPKFFTPRRRGVAMFAACLIAVSGLGWAASTLKNDGKSAVTVKVDEKPVSSANSPLGPSYAPIVKRVAPSVVRVEVSEKSKTVAVDGQMSPFANNPGFREFFGDQFGQQQQGRGSKRRGQLFQQQPAQEGLGSGVIVSADGYILTNNHVVQGADTIKVALNDGRELTAKVVGTDPQSDLAVIKVDAKGLPAITFADSEQVEVGDRVLAVGNPFGIGQTVTSGMVSGLGRATMGLDYEDFIQTDAAINPGNSGGALVDGEGRLVGINTAILSRSGGSQGIGFAIPGNLARNVMEQLATNGKVVRGFVGVSVQDINPELAEQFKLTAREGALIAEVTPDGPAAKAGIKGGDVITSFGGKTVKDGRHLKLAVANVAPGSKVEAEVVRDGKTVKMDISVTERPGEKALARAGGRNRGGPSADDEDTGTLNGVGVADIDPQSRREFDMPDRLRGALVTSVEPESPAAAAGLQPGDVILEINRKAVKGADDAIKLTEKTESKKTLLRVWNQRGSRFVVVDETKAPGGSSE